MVTRYGDNNGFLGIIESDGDPGGALQVFMPNLRHFAGRRKREEKTMREEAREFAKE